MRNKTLAAICFFAALGCLLFGFLGQTSQSIFLAVGIVFLILSYAANRRPLPVDPLTGQKKHKDDNWDGAVNERQSPAE
jgi:hypothetical protein